MFLDRKKNLWIIADNNRLGIWDTKKFLFNEVPIPPEKRKFFLPQHFFELPTGELMLIKADGSLLHYKEKEKRLVLARI
jgi:hypothetical protein